MDNFPDYLFNPKPPFPFKYQWVIIGIFCLTIIFGIFIPILIKMKSQDSPPYKALSSKISNLIWFGFIGLLLLFFRWQSIPYLSARLLFFILLIALFFWLIFLVRYITKDFKKQLKDYQEKIQKLKYLKLPEKEMKKWLNQKR